MIYQLPVWTAAVLVAPLVVAGSGCASHQVTPMQYTQNNPYAPGGIMYESWEQKRAIDGLLNDSRVTHSAIGAGGGAIAGQAIGRDTEGTLWGTGIGLVAGATSGGIDDHNRRIDHEDRMTRTANDWQMKHNQTLQDQRDVALGASVTQADIDRRRARLEAARRALAERDRNVDTARQMREMDAEIARLDATVTSRGPG